MPASINSLIISCVKVKVKLGGVEEGCVVVCIWFFSFLVSILQFNFLFSRSVNFFLSHFLLSLFLFVFLYISCSPSPLNGFWRLRSFLRLYKYKLETVIESTSAHLTWVCACLMSFHLSIILSCWWFWFIYVVSGCSSVEVGVSGLRSGCSHGCCSFLELYSNMLRRVIGSV